MLESPAANSSPARSPILLEVFGAYALATGVAAAIYRVRALDDWFHVLVAALFLYLPVWLLRRHDLARYGLTMHLLGRGLTLVGLAVLVVFPPFFVGFVLWQKIACASALLRPLAAAPCAAGPLLAELARHVHLRWPPGLLTLDPRRNLLFAELVVVALPEEFFFRGYVQGRLSDAWPAATRFRVLGTPVGLPLVVASSLFALSHVLVQGNLATLAVFFPGLVFGWMRARTGSIFASTLFHALCNIYIDTLTRSLYG